MKTVLLWLGLVVQALGAVNPATNPASGGSILGDASPRNLFHFGQFKPFAFTLSVTPVSRITIPGTLTPGLAVADTIVDRQVNATTVNDFAVLAIPSPYNRSTESISITSSNPAHVSNPVNGLMSYVANGTANIQAASSSYSMVQAVNAATQGSQIVDTFVEFAPASLTRHIRDTFDTRLAGKSVSTALNLYSARSDATATYTRNAALWAADVDWTCVSVWNSTGGVNMAGTLISPRHVLFAAHYLIGTGSTLRFVKADGTVVTRTMTAMVIAPGFGGSYPDWAVGLLNADVPEGITFATILPADYETKIVSIIGTPAAAFNQFKELLARDVQNLTGPPVAKVRFQLPTDSKRLEFYKDIVSGDSGSPAFWIINNHPVLLTVWTSGDAGKGTNIFIFKDEINAAMTGLGGGYQLTEEDLSGFPSY